MNIHRDYNIVFTGFMGSGKTFVGRYIAIELGKKFIDTDQEIEKIYNKNISEIFNLYGEKYFRDIEFDVCKKICDSRNSVIATGGGTLLYKKNLNLFLNKSLIIFLDTPFDVCYQRILNTDRPLVSRLSKLQLFDLYKSRKQAYSDVADLLITNKITY